MSKRIKMTERKRVRRYGDDDKAPFWIEHFLLLLFGGLGVIVVGMVMLSLSDWGRAALVWIGLGTGICLTVWLAIAPIRSARGGEPARVWGGEALSAIGWGGMAIFLAAGIPYFFWRGADNAPEWAFAVPGAGAVLFTGIAVLGMWLQTRGPLPALDRTPRQAHVILNTDDAEGGQCITVRYRGVDGEQHEADLADLIDDSWMDRFVVGAEYQVYAFRDPQFADSVVFLTEQHDDVWRDGYKLDGVRLGGEGGPLKPGPGSPFLREDGKWTFES